MTDTVEVAVNGTNIPATGIVFVLSKDKLSITVTISAKVPAGDQTVDFNVLLSDGTKIGRNQTLNFVMAKGGGCDSADDSDPDD